MIDRNEKNRVKEFKYNSKRPLTELRHLMVAAAKTGVSGPFLCVAIEYRSHDVTPLNDNWTGSTARNLALTTRKLCAF